ncbi:NAD(P)-binding domain-containing protein [Bacillus sp. UNC438CL73TsuS30]|uniref:NAD(P)-binding domain-containing protein n=1 Tax=Bacillus sp. UNC438CL73TsuS30 TaxID=1340434 RepID=UPI000552A2F2|nr:NAD(P)-binding domain-containing protein [Bacillus sp. UNC438CL73TsuS30]
MEQCKVGLVGIGKLGTAMMKQWEKMNRKIGIYHPLKTKAEQFVEQFPNGSILIEQELKELDVLILALPAATIIPFITNLKLESNLPASTTIVNMATTLDTKEIKEKFPSLNIEGVKFMGHWKDLLEHGHGLFITEKTLPKPIVELYQGLGAVKLEKESCLTEINKLATYYAVKTAVELESEFERRGFPQEYVQRALMSLAPEVIRGYCEGSLGHFAKEIVKEIKQKPSKDR